MTDALAGARVVVPVTQGRRALAEALRARGAKVIECAFIEIAPASDPATLREAAVRWCDGDYDWMAVTSRNALTALVDAAADAGRDLSRPAGRSRLAVVGEATARASVEAGLTADLRPSGQQSAAGLVAEFPDGPGRVLAPLGNLAGPVLHKGLTRKGWDVDEVEAYRTVDGPGMGPDIVEQLTAGQVDAAVLTSGSVARRFAAQCPEPAPGVALVAIGATTASAARTAGLPVAATAAKPDYQGVIDALRRALEGEHA